MFVKLEGQKLTSRFEAVADPAIRQNIMRLGGIRLDFLAKLANKYAQVFGLFGAVVPPNRSEQGTVWNDAVRVLHHVQKEIEFLGGEMNPVPLDAYGTSGQINLEVTDIDRFGKSFFGLWSSA